ncbi:MAG TPA: hypothetical protein VG733_18985, partial [Chthoniobacteraceae bacterium]|nr:hypothetical protein [Chthoniobacteraceae bacterium]
FPNAGAVHAADTDAKPNRLSPEVLKVMQNAKTATLFSLAPDGVQAPAGAEDFHGHAAVLGKMALDAKQSAVAIRAFEDAVVNWQGLKADCFEPRHGLRIVSGKHVYDFVLCYACGRLCVYRDKDVILDLGVKGSPKVLNALLVTKKIPLAPEF